MKEPIKSIGKQGITLNKKKDTLSENLIPSGMGDNFEEELRKSVEELKKELDDRKACFVGAHNEIFDEKITAEDVELNDFEDLQDLCELYHRLRADKRILN